MPLRFFRSVGVKYRCRGRRSVTGRRGVSGIFSRNLLPATSTCTTHLHPLLVLRRCRCSVVRSSFGSLRSEDASDIRYLAFVWSRDVLIETRVFRRNYGPRGRRFSLVSRFPERSLVDRKLVAPWTTNVNVRRLLCVNMN